MSSSLRPNRSDANTYFKWAILIIVVAVSAVGAGIYGYWYYRTHRFDKLIIACSNEQGLDPRLVKSLIFEESFFNPMAESRAEARGLMQITPIVIKEWSIKKGYSDERTAFVKEFGSRIRTSNLSIEQLTFDPEINLTLGCWYLRYLLNRYESQSLQIPLTLASYNAGPSKAEIWLHHGLVGTPLSEAKSIDEYLSRIDYPETRDYVQNIMIRYNSYKRANSGL